MIDVLMVKFQSQNETLICARSKKPKIHYLDLKFLFFKKFKTNFFKTKKTLVHPFRNNRVKSFQFRDRRLKPFLKMDLRLFSFKAAIYRYICC